jgi:putative peptidoglycan lipid II flippase
VSEQPETPLPLSDNGEKPHSYGKSAALVSFLTLCSRVSGVIRDGALASLLGASLANDLFQLCFELPNLARRVVGDSALAPLALPLRRDALAKHGRPGVEALATRGVLLFLGAGAAMALLGAMAAPWVVRAFLPAWSDLAQSEAGREILGRAETLVRVSSLFMGALLAASFLAALLQGERDFLFPALGGLPLNFLLIALATGALLMWGVRGSADSAGAFLSNATTWTVLLALAWGVAAGGFLRLLLMIVGAWRAGLRPRWSSEAGKDLGRRTLHAAPLLATAAVPQLHVSTHLMLVSLAPPLLGAAGALSALRYAHRVMEFPLALVAGALAATTLPAMLDDRGKASAREDVSREEAARSLATSLRRFFWLGVPAAVGLAMLARPSVALLFQRGAWSAADSAECARFLVAWSAALVPLGACLVIVPAGMAFAGVRPMLRDGLLSLALGAGVSGAIYWRVGDPAWLPLGVVIAETWRLRQTTKRLQSALGRTETYLSPTNIVRWLALPVVASGAMAAALAWLIPVFLPAEVVETGGFGALVWRVGLVSGMGATVYFAVWGAVRGAGAAFGRGKIS